MLDGASRIGEVVAAVVADGQPAVGITDHGNMYGVARAVHARAQGAGITPVLGMEGYFTNTSRFDRPKRSEHEIFHLTMLAETNAGLPQPHPGHERRVPRRLLLQAPHRLGAARASPRGHHRDDGLPRRARLAADPRRTSTQAALEAAARFQDIFGREQLLHRAPGPRPRRRRAGDPAAARHRAQARRAAARDQRQPLHAKRRRRGARRVAVRADRRAAERHESLQVRRRQLLHQERGRDARRVPRSCPKRATTRC